MRSLGDACFIYHKLLLTNPPRFQAYYRRALASAAILKPKDALQDFRICVKLNPGNVDAKAKLTDCQKVVRQLQFFEAIEVGDEPSAAEGLDVESMVVKDDYDGVRLGDEMTQEFIDDMTERFKEGKKIHMKYVYQILLAVTKIVHAEPTMKEVHVPDDTTLTVCGDTHGQYFDLMELFRLNGKPSEKHWYLFNGDFVDRGSWSTEIALLLYANKWLRPEAFFLNRGNHETDDMNRAYGFEGECKAKYNDRVFRLFSESFSALPLATLIGEKYFVLHGGLFSDDNVTLDDIRKLDRHKQRQPGQAGLMMEMLWTDPQTEPGRGPSKRGVGMQFGPDVTARFCEKNGLEAIIRSHEVRMDGYEEEHNGKCITGKFSPCNIMIIMILSIILHLVLILTTSSLLCTKVLRHDREPRRVHQHRLGLQAQLPPVRRRATPQHPPNGESPCLQYILIFYLPWLTL